MQNVYEIDPILRRMLPTAVGQMRAADQSVWAAVNEGIIPTRPQNWGSMWTPITPQSLPSFGVPQPSPIPNAAPGPYPVLMGVPGGVGAFSGDTHLAGLPVGPQGMGASGIGGGGHLGVLPLAVMAAGSMAWKAFVVITAATGAGAGAAWVASRDYHEFEDGWTDPDIFDTRMGTLSTAYERLNQNISACPDFWHDTSRVLFRDSWLQFSQWWGGLVLPSFGYVSEDDVREARRFSAEWRIYQQYFAEQHAAGVCPNVQMFYPVEASPPVDPSEGTAQAIYDALPEEQKAAIEAQAEQPPPLEGVTGAIKWGVAGVAILVGGLLVKEVFDTFQG